MDSDDDCEICFARTATTTADVGGIETLVCNYCNASPLTPDGELTVPGYPW